MKSAGTQRKPMNQSDDGIKGESWIISAKLKMVNPPAIPNLLLNSPDEMGMLQPSNANGININVKKTAAKTATKIRFFLETSRPENVIIDTDLFELLDVGFLKLNCSANLVCFR